MEVEMSAPYVREEEPWSDNNEIFMTSLFDLCKTKVDQHERAGYLFKEKNARWGLPAILLPTIMAPVSVLIEDHPDVGKYINALAFITTGVFVGVTSFFKFGEKMANHFNIASRYADVASDIELELIKGRRFRLQIDVFSTKIHMILDSLSANEPVLPKFISNDEKYNTKKISYRSIKQEEV